MIEYVFGFDDLIEAILIHDKLLFRLVCKYFKSGSIKVNKR